MEHAHFARKILVTGGAGFIGSALAERLISNSDNFVVIVDDLSTGHIGKLPRLPKGNWKFIKADVNNYREISEVMVAFQFDYVFHYAAMVGVQRTQKNPVKVLDDIEGIKHICNLSKNTGVKRVFFASSSEIYGEPVEIPQNTLTTPLNSRYPYAVVKNIGESFLRSFNQEYGLEYTIFRFFNTYGPRQSKDFVISKFLYRAATGRDIEIYGDGLQTRTFCYIDDNIEACLAAFYENKIVNDVVNIGHSQEITVLELAQKVVQVSGWKTNISHLPPLKDGDMTRRCPDNSTMKDELLQRDLVSLEEGIKRIIDNGLFELQSEGISLKK